VRVLYDHSDDTVRMLLAKAHAALADGGRLIVAEPMSGGARPMRSTDAYFAVYCMAMRTGRVRSAEDIANLLTEAGFSDVSAGQNSAAVHHRCRDREEVLKNDIRHVHSC
jgi:demethylspheroidene O-methyltransferase